MLHLADHWQLSTQHLVSACPLCWGHFSSLLRTFENIPADSCLAQNLIWPSGNQVSAPPAPGNAGQPWLSVLLQIDCSSQLLASDFFFRCQVCDCSANGQFLWGSLWSPPHSIPDEWKKVSSPPAVEMGQEKQHSADSLQSNAQQGLLQFLG